MITQLKNIIVLVTSCVIIFTAFLVIQYYSQKIIYDGISYDVKRNQISKDSSIITDDDLITTNDIRWAKRTVTFTFDSGVEEYIIGVNSNGLLCCRKLR